MADDRVQEPTVASDRVHSKHQIKIGDTIAIRPRTPRDWMTVTRIDDQHVYGYRNVPEPWERHIEFCVYRGQIVNEGVTIARPTDG